MNVSLREAQEKRLQFEEMYRGGGRREFGDTALDKLTKMKAGCLYRREFAALGRAETDRREILQAFIALEEPTLWTLSET